MGNTTHAADRVWDATGRADGQADGDGAQPRRRGVSPSGAHGYFAAMVVPSDRTPAAATCRAGVILDSRAAARKTCDARTVAQCDATGPVKRGAPDTPTREADEERARRKGRRGKGGGPGRQRVSEVGTCGRGGGCGASRRRRATRRAPLNWLK